MVHAPGYAATRAAHSGARGGRTFGNGAPARMSQRQISRGLQASRRLADRASGRTLPGSSSINRSLARARERGLGYRAANIRGLNRAAQAAARAGHATQTDPRRTPGSRGFAAAGFRGRLVDRDFDRRRLWERFNDRDRDFARRRFHDGFVGWIGPVFWPYAVDDIVDYALWPYDYGPLVYAYGVDDIYESIFWPYADDDAAFYANDGTGRRGGWGRGRAAAPAPTAGSFAQACGTDQTPDIANWPIRQIGQTVQPTAEQRPLLDELARASAKAADIIKAACPRQIPVTPTGRLTVMESRLTAMREAVDVVAPALTQFYASLDDEQKARFNVMGKPAGEEDPATLAKACASQAAHLPQWPTDRIAAMLRLTPAQRAKLDNVQATAAQAADMLKASCPTAIPATPPARLDAVAQRLDTLLQAVTTVRGKLEAFYAALSDEQKAQFNRIGAVASG